MRTSFNPVTGCMYLYHRKKKENLSEGTKSNSPQNEIIWIPIQPDSKNENSQI